MTIPLSSMGPRGPFSKSDDIVDLGIVHRLMIHLASIPFCLGFIEYPSWKVDHPCFPATIAFNFASLMQNE